MGLIKKQAGVDLETRIQTWVDQLCEDLEIIVKSKPVEILNDNSILVTAFPRLTLLWLLKRREDIPDYIMVNFSLSPGIIDLTLTDPTHDIDWIASKIDKINTHIRGLKKIRVTVGNDQKEYMFRLEEDSKWTFQRLRM